MGTTYWPVVHAERRALLEQLSAIEDDAGWERPSLCPGWTTHDVLAHLVDDARSTPWRFATGFVRARFDFDALNAQFQSGETSIDVIGGDVVWPAQFAAGGYIADLSDRFPGEEREAFLPAAIEANTYEGKIYGVPWYTDAGMLYYRRDLLEGSGFSEPPRTWDELKETVRGQLDQARDGEK